MNHRQWPEVSDFVSRFCTLQHAQLVLFSHVRVFSDSRNVQKSVTQIIYLGPLPNEPSLHMWPSPGPWPDGKYSKTVIVGCQREIATEFEKNNYRERGNIKARVSVH